MSEEGDDRGLVDILQDLLAFLGEQRFFPLE